jgi:hypothetical protein
MAGGLPKPPRTERRIVLQLQIAVNCISAVLSFVVMHAEPRSSEGAASCARMRSPQDRWPLRNPHALDRPTLTGTFKLKPFA